MKFLDKVTIVVSYLALCATCSQIGQVEHDYPYRPCPRSCAANIVIRDWDSGTRNGTNNVSFGVSTDFNDFTAQLFQRELQHNSIVRFHGPFDHFAPVSVQQSDSDLYDQITPAFVQGYGERNGCRDGHGRPHREAARHRRPASPGPPESQVSRHVAAGPVCRVSGRGHSATIWTAPPNPVSGGGGGPAGTFGSFACGFLNEAISYYVDCAALWLSPSLVPENDTIIDPNMSFTCPFTVQDPDVYPNTTFGFDKATRQVSIRQDWRCEDDSGEDGHVDALGRGNLLL
ncbi:hypothetical protein PG994_000525 [Apiospora phragmitis]|uniref:Uncharacterized protein n=1 Tax=Apiospora phragmitis TaxID=2905665 RepID=A0ABR1X6F8_9PEZI